MAREAAPFSHLRVSRQEPLHHSRSRGEETFQNSRNLDAPSPFLVPERQWHPQVNLATSEDEYLLLKAFRASGGLRWLEVGFRV